MSDFMKAALIRALRTFAQALIACISTAAILSDVDWGEALSAAVLAALLSVLNSIVTGLPEVDGKGKHEGG